MRSLAIAAALLLVPGAAAATRVELPIREVDLSNGDRRYAVEITIGGKGVEAGLDTGSTGLRVLPRGLPSDALRAGGASSDYSYTSGTRLQGKLIPVPVAIGGVAGTVKLVRIDAIGCTARQPACPARRIDFSGFGIQGDGLPGQGFAAILGIGLRSDPDSNPLEQLGVRRWIVELPLPGSGVPGRLILDPSDQEVAGYQRVQVVGDSNATRGCITPEPPLQSVCGLALFDSGAPGIRIATSRPFPPWPQGTSATLAVGDRNQQVAMTVQIGRRDQASAMFVVERLEASPPRISFGIAPYFRWSVLYDPGAYEIGVRDR